MNPIGITDCAPLNLGESQAVIYLQITTDYTANPDEHIQADSSGGNITITLPTAPGNAGKLVAACKTSAENSVTIGSTILTENGSYAILRCDGSKWT